MKVFTSYLLQCLRVLIERVRRIHFIAIEEPQRGDTPAKPRAQALG